MAPPLSVVGDIDPRSQFTADGIQTTFVCAWVLRSLDELRLVIGEVDEVESVYSVTGVNDDAGFAIVFDQAPAEGTVITAYREGALARSANYGQETQFSARAVNAQEINTLLRLQEMRSAQRRGVTRALTDPATGQLRMPLPVAGQYLRWDESGNLVSSTVEPPDVTPPDSHVTTKYLDDIVGLDFTAGADNGALLQEFLDDLSAGGGGKLVGDGRAISLLTSTALPSFVTAEGLKLSLGPTAAFGIAGGKKAAFTGIRLVSDAAAGTPTMVWDTSGAGGDAISAYAPIGSPASIKDGISQESVTIIGVDDGARTVTLSSNLTYNYSASSTTVTIEVAARLASDNTPRSDQVTVEAADVAQLAVGDWVMLEDDRRTGGATTYLEIRQIVGIETAGDNIISLSGQTRRSYLVAQHARLTVLEPARRSALIGCSVECFGAASSDRYDPLFEVRYALDSLLQSCEYAGTDTTGRRGNMFRIHKSYNSHAMDCIGRNPLYTNEGEGNVGVIAYSTLCSMQRLYAQGARHGGQFIAATESALLDCTSVDTLLTALEGHGLNSVGCYIRGKEISFTSRTASASNVAFALGNASWQDGDHECTIEAPNLGPFQGNSGVAVARVFTPSTHPTLKNIHANDVQKFLIHRDTSGAGTLTVEGLAVIDCSVRRCADRVFDLQGKASGGSVKSLVSAKITGFRGEGLTRGILAYDVDGLVIEDSSFEFATPDTISERYLLAAKRTDGLYVVGTKGYAPNRGWDLEDCENGFFLDSHLVGLGDTEWLKDRGGCDDTEFRLCSAYPASGDPAVRSGTSSTMSIKPVSNLGNESVAAYEFSDANKFLAADTGAGPGVERDISDDGYSLLAAADFAAMRAALDLEPGTDVQAQDAELAAIAGLTSAEDRLPYFTGSGTAALATFTGTARSLLDDGNFATMRTTLGLEIGADVQAYDADLEAIAGLTSAADKGIHFTGSGTAAVHDLTSFARTILDDTSAVAVMTTLGTKSTTLQIPFSGGGADIAVGTQLNIQVPWNVTVTGWRLVSGSGSGSIVIDIWKNSFVNYPPSVAETVAGSEKPTLSSAETAEDLSLTTWTDVSWDAEEWVRFNVDSCSGVQSCTLVLLVDRR